MPTWFSNLTNGIFGGSDEEEVINQSNTTQASDQSHYRNTQGYSINYDAVLRQYQEQLRARNAELERQQQQFFRNFAYDTITISSPTYESVRVDVDEALPVGSSIVFDGADQYRTMPKVKKIKRNLPDWF